MTKTLTEQERKELESLTKKVSDVGVNTYWSDIGTKINSYKKITERIKLRKDDFVIKSKTERLEKQLAIATKALKKYMTFCRHPAEEALKEMEGVK